MRNENIQSVSDAHLCLGCGTCLPLCPQKSISILENAAGFLEAHVDSTKCNRCGVCMRICPGIRLQEGLLNQEKDPFIGTILAAYYGQALDQEILTKGQSGGIGTALLCYLLDSGNVEEAIVTQLSQSQGLFRPNAFAASSADDVKSAQGSKYCRVAVNAVALRESSESKAKRQVIVGLPCHVHGLRNVYAHQKEANYKEPLMIGLMCDRILSYHAIEHLIARTGLNYKEADEFKYRTKEWHGWPGDVCVRTRQGKNIYISKIHRMIIKDTFTPLRCRLCFDKLNVLSDLVIGDPWGVKSDLKGGTVILVRNERGHEVLLNAKNAGYLWLEDIDAKLVLKGQSIDRKRRDWTAYIQAYKQRGGSVPDFGILPKWQYNNSNNNNRLTSYRKELEWNEYVENMTDADKAARACRWRLQKEHFRKISTPIRIFRAICRRIVSPLFQRIKSAIRNDR